MRQMADHSVHSFIADHAVHAERGGQCVHSLTLPLHVFAVAAVTRSLRSRTLWRQFPLFRGEGNFLNTRPGKEMEKQSDVGLFVCEVLHKMCSSKFDLCSCSINFVHVNVDFVSVDALFSVPNAT